MAGSLHIYFIWYALVTHTYIGRVKEEKGGQRGESKIVTKIMNRLSGWIMYYLVLR